jgi:hypothetical protein
MFAYPCILKDGQYFAKGRNEQLLAINPQGSFLPGEANRAVAIFENDRGFAQRAKLLFEQAVTRITGRNRPTMFNPSLDKEDQLQKIYNQSVELFKAEVDELRTKATRYLKPGVKITLNHREWNTMQYIDKIDAFIFRNTDNEMMVLTTAQLYLALRMVGITMTSRSLKTGGNIDVAIGTSAVFSYANTFWGLQVYTGVVGSEGNFVEQAFSIKGSSNGKDLKLTTLDGHQVDLCGDITTQRIWYLTSTSGGRAESMFGHLALSRVYSRGVDTNVGTVAGNLHSVITAASRFTGTTLSRTFEARVRPGGMYWRGLSIPAGSILEINVASNRTQAQAGTFVVKSIPEGTTDEKVLKAVRRKAEYLFAAHSKSLSKYLVLPNILDALIEQSQMPTVDSLIAFAKSVGVDCSSLEMKGSEDIAYARERADEMTALISSMDKDKAVEPATVKVVSPSGEAVTLGTFQNLQVTYAG